MELVLAALALDALLGDPDWIWRRVPHPVTIVGRAIDWADVHFNREAWAESRRRLAGALALAGLVAAGCLFASGLAMVCRRCPGGFVLEALLASTLLAQNSLFRHVRRVQRAFAEGLPAARTSVGMIVGRDTRPLDAAGVCRAAIESCAENFSDGIVAPAVFLALGGLPGLVAYKIVNTADSMIGHLTPRHAAFGWAAARLDDVLNLLPARLAALLLALQAPTFGVPLASVLATILRDGPRHRSPNAGWPESGMAALLGLALGGPRQYAALAVEAPVLNACGRRQAEPADIARSLRALVGGCLGLAALATILALVT